MDGPTPMALCATLPSAVSAKFLAAFMSCTFVIFPMTFTFLGIYFFHKHALFFKGRKIEGGIKTDLFHKVLRMAHND